MEYNTSLRVNNVELDNHPFKLKIGNRVKVGTKWNEVIKKLMFHKMVPPLQYGPIQQHAPCVLDTNHRLMILQGTGSTK